MQMSYRVGFMVQNVRCSTQPTPGKWRCYFDNLVLKQNDFRLIWSTVFSKLLLVETLEKVFAYWTFDPG